MKTTSITRLDSSIEVYRDRIIIPRKVATTWSKGNGASETDISFTASILHDEDPSDGFCQTLDEFKTLEGTIRIAKLTIDLAIASWQEYV